MRGRSEAFCISKRTDVLQRCSFRRNSWKQSSGQCQWYPWYFVFSTRISRSTHQTRPSAWAKKGIVGRGFLLDFRNWRLCNNIAYEPFKTGSISLSQLKAVAKSQGTEIKFGDILLLRTGYIAAFNKLSKDQAEAYPSVVPPNLSGVEQSEEVLE